MKYILSTLILSLAVSLSFAENAEKVTPLQYCVLLTVAESTPKNAPLAVTINFRDLLANKSTMIPRDSIRIKADKTSLPCTIIGDLENKGEATIAWRSTDPKRLEYALCFEMGDSKKADNADLKSRSSLGPIGIGDTFRYNNGKSGPSNITPLHSQFLHLDWDGDGLRDLIGWGFRLFEHGETLEKRLGNAVYFLKNVGTKDSPLFLPRRRLLDSEGNYLRSDLLPQNWFVDDWDSDGDPDFYGFGPALWLNWWENTGKRDANGLWVLKPAQKVIQLREESEFREQRPGILRKRLAWAPRGVRRIDWEGDGDVDLIVGYRKVSRIRKVDTSKGVAPYGTAVMVYDLLENTGTNEKGEVNYKRPVTLTDLNGIVIHGRGHANGCVEYADWDGDGDFDLLFHSETDRPLEGGRLTFCENRGSREEPLFEAPMPIGVKIVDSPFLVDWNDDGRPDMISNGEFFENVNSKSQVKRSLPDPFTRSPQHAAALSKPVRGRTVPGTRIPKISTYPKLISRGIAKQVDPEIMSYFTISVDWENDGDLDLVGGFHMGLRLFKNSGTTLNPVFEAPVMLDAGGKQISMPNWVDPQSDDPSTFGPQGPTEPIYGWLCPTMGDWDGDGDLDLFVTGQRWETKYFENMGSREAPIFAKGKTVTVNGLTDELAWRSKVSIGDIDGDGTMDLVIHSDRDNAFYICDLKKNQPDPSRLDFTRRVALKLESGEPVTGWFGGQNNNSDNHTLLVDWDGDGDLDLIKGTVWSVYYYENTGSPMEPRFKAHGKFQLNGKDLQAYNHACSFDAADWNEDGRMDLVHGTEGPSDQPRGAVLHLFDRAYLEGKLPAVSIGKPERLP
ncbi:FG-GAP-like repeat-containing protein [uncultured Gimesia sp.]|uniref:FG-GAP-like repeat-containing protein n=1 Tax=uncultured Gimesia sp. TaxID=1678688 RepID=UPI00261BA581|nr:FG-GAP-like repeat-containing protein [uncultured Gimesia sp.]